jgi:uroporphyrinogen-III synthase
LAVKETTRTRKATPRSRPRTLWITRAQPGADATAARVRELGIDPIVAPLLEVRPIEDADLDLAGVSALAFTSANAVAAFAARSPERSLRVFAVGDATAAAARAQRFTSVLSAQGDVAALASALAARRRELAGVILYPAAAEPSQDLAGALAAVGLVVRQAAVYETVAVGPPGTFAERLHEIDGVLLHSAKAAQGLARFVKANPAPQLVAYCLSRQIARALGRANLAQTLSAAQPNETALLTLVAGG